VSSCEHGNEHQGYIKSIEFFYWFSELAVQEGLCLIELTTTRILSTLGHLWRSKERGTTFLVLRIFILKLTHSMEQGPLETNSRSDS
jgi:hypothetical protein